MAHVDEHGGGEAGWRLAALAQHGQLVVDLG